MEEWDGAKFSNESDWIDGYIDQVNDAAALYVWGNTEGSWWGRGTATSAMATHDSAESILKLFLNALKQRIVEESKE